MKINLSHGNGAEETSQLIESVFMSAFKNEWNRNMEDSAILDIELQKGCKLAFTTDSFVVDPLFFSGGDIGRLAVCGTVNDLLTTGAKPLYLSASFIIEEGMDSETLSKIAVSMRTAADEAGVFIVTGDTKVIEGNGGLYINTSGIGLVEQNYVTSRAAEATDTIIVTGTLGDHHACILSSRMEIKNNIKSDAAPLTDIVRALQNKQIPLHGLRDITRGGLGTILNEITDKARLRAIIDESALPVSDDVKGLCAILGLDPVYMGNEGKMLIIVPEAFANQALQAVKQADYGKNAAIIGHFEAQEAYCANVSMRTALGTYRIVPTLSGEGLPRIC